MCKEKKQCITCNRGPDCDWSNLNCIGCGAIRRNWEKKTKIRKSGYYLKRGLILQLLWISFCFIVGVITVNVIWN